MRPVLYLENNGTLNYISQKELYKNVVENRLSWREYIHGASEEGSENSVFLDIDEKFYEESRDKDKSILEIGPGTGNLTKYILNI